jgi:hypothetical protein
LHLLQQQRLEPIKNEFVTSKDLTIIKEIFKIFNSGAQLDNTLKKIITNLYNSIYVFNYNFSNKKVDFLLECHKTVLLKKTLDDFINYKKKYT